MSSATVVEPVIAVSKNGPVLSPVEYVRSLSIDGKEEALIALLEEVLEIHDGDGPIFFEKEGRGSLGYWVTPKLAKYYHDEQMKTLPPEIRDEMKRPRPIRVPFEDCLSAEEALAMAKAQEDAECR